MASYPCYEILGLERDVEQNDMSIVAAYQRLKVVFADTGSKMEDLEAAYEILGNAKKRECYILNWQPFSASEWTWMEHEDDDGVWRSLVRKSKEGRKKEWDDGDDHDRRNIKKTKQNDRKGNRDKRRGGGGYDD
jgi:hypothetical protein